MRGLRTFVLLIAAGAVAPPPALAASGTGPRGGLVVPLGELTGEICVWERFVEVFVYDRVGRPIFTKELKGSVVARGVVPERRSSPQTGALTARGDRLRGDVALEGAASAELTLALEASGRRREATVAWRDDQDRCRLGDWWMGAW